MQRLATALASVDGMLLSLHLPTAGVQSIAISVFVCLSVRSHILKTRVQIPRNFLYIYLCPWLGPPLPAKEYVMYFGFCGRRHVFT